MNIIVNNWTYTGDNKDESWTCYKLELDVTKLFYLSPKRNNVPSLLKLPVSTKLMVKSNELNYSRPRVMFGSMCRCSMLTESNFTVQKSLFFFAFYCWTSWFSWSLKASNALAAAACVSGLAINSCTAPAAASIAPLCCSASSATVSWRPASDSASFISN